MHVVVTGGGGFIGGYVVEALQARGHVPIIFDHHARRERPPGAEVFLGDVMSSVAVTEAMAHADGWVHLAAVLGTQETMGNPRPAVLSNVTGGMNVLEAAAQYGLPGAYIGVGNHWMNNPYSISKTTVERLIAMYNAYRGTRVNIVRAMNAYGPRQLAPPPYGNSKVRKITPTFISRALLGQPLELYGGGRQTSDMVWVGDVARALVLALEAAAEGRVFDRAVEVGPAEHNTVREVAELIVRLAGSTSQLLDVPMRPGEIPDATVIADTATLELVGMRPADLVPLADGMARTVEWFMGRRTC